MDARGLLVQQVCLLSKAAAVEACQDKYLNIISPLKSKVSVSFSFLWLFFLPHPQIPTRFMVILGIYIGSPHFIPTFALQKHYLFSTSIPDMFRVFTLYSINSRPRRAAVFDGVMDWVWRNKMDQPSSAYIHTMHSFLFLPDLHHQGYSITLP